MQTVTIKFLKTSFILLAMSTLMSGCFKKKEAADTTEKNSAEKVVVKLEPKSDSEVSGEVEFISEATGGVRVKANIKGLFPNQLHGFHIHEKPDCSADDATSAGGHFNPSEHEHGAPDDEMSHAGDLGNIESDEEGNVVFDKVFSKISLKPADKTYIINRSIVVHAGPDDMKSQPAGDAGARVACGAITL